MDFLVRACNLAIWLNSKAINLHLARFRTIFPNKNHQVGLLKKGIITKFTIFFRKNLRSFWQNSIHSEWYFFMMPQGLPRCWAWQSQVHLASLSWPLFLLGRKKNRWFFRSNLPPPKKKHGQFNSSIFEPFLCVFLNKNTHTTKIHQSNHQLTGLFSGKKTIQIAKSLLLYFQVNPWGHVMSCLHGTHLLRISPGHCIVPWNAKQRHRTRVRQNDANQDLKNWHIIWKMLARIVEGILVRKHIWKDYLWILGVDLYGWICRNIHGYA